MLWLCDKFVLEKCQESMDFPEALGAIFGILAAKTEWYQRPSESVTELVSQQSSGT